MEVNREEAERCFDMGAQALKNGDFDRAVKLLSKSTRMYPLPGVEALLHQAKKLQSEQSNRSSDDSSTHCRSSNGHGSSTATSARASSTDATSSTASRRPPAARRSDSVGSNEQGRSYTAEQVQVVRTVLRAKEQGGRGVHYRVLALPRDASEADIKRAYRKLALRLHPDKNSAPHADEAFKAVGLAYATLSDAQKRSIYDRYGDEDPDHPVGGGMRHRRGGGGMRPGDDVSPEEIFNMFFGGGMPGAGVQAGGGPGFRVYTTGFGPGGVHFGGGRPRARRQGQQPQQQQGPLGFGALVQVLPLLLLMLVSFFRAGDFDGSAPTGMPGEGKYFSLVNKMPFTNPLVTRLTPVKDIPFYVTDKFMRTYARDRHQLGQVERMVERAYENFLLKECKGQRAYKKRLEDLAKKETDTEEAARRLKVAQEFEVGRCSELEELFAAPKRQKQERAYATG